MKMLPNNNLVLNAVPATTNVNSVAQWSDKIIRASFMVFSTNAGDTGNIQLQTSNDFPVGLPANQFQPSHWTNLGSPVVIVGGGTAMVTYQELCYEYLRIVFTSTNGAATGFITVRMKS